MPKTIFKSLAIAATLVASAVPVTSATAQDGGGDPMYERYYYDDLEMTQQVGYERDTCNYYGVGGSRTQGRYGPYVQQNLIAYCDHGVLQPF